MKCTGWVLGSKVEESSSSWNSGLKGRRSLDSKRSVFLNVFVDILYWASDFFGALM